MTVHAPLQTMSRGEHFRAFGLHVGELTNPILGLDHAWMSGPTFPPHPHAGFSAVSYLFLDSETGIDNRDSLGGRQSILPGGLHWTAAGRGVVHEENPKVTGKTVHMLQIFVNLAQAKQSDLPFALALAPQDVPELNRPGVRVRVPLGEFEGLRSPLSPPTEVRLLDVTLADAAALAVSVAAGHTAFLLPIAGSVIVDGETLSSGGSPVPVWGPSPQSHVIRLQASGAGAQVAVFSGEPLDQPVHWQGPMALASPEALAQAMAAYRRGEFGHL